MKKLLLFVFATLAFAACTQNDVEELSANRVDIPETLTIGFEGDDTRIQLNEAQKTVWTKDDLVSVFYRSNANQKWQFQGETGERVGNLRRVSDATATETMHRTVVVYPYNENYYINPETYNIDAMLPAVQHYAEESYGVGENLMVSQSEFTQFSLKNVFGWLKIQLTGNGEKVTSLTLRGNKEEQLAGLIYVDTATAESTLASEMGSSDDNNAGGNLIFDDTIVTELTLDCGEGVVLGAEATTFYIAVPPQTFEQGVAVEILCDGYKPMTLATTSEVVIERNHIKPMESVAFEAQEIIPYNEIRYTATAKVEMDWTSDTFGANISSHEWDSESGEGVITFDTDVTTIGDSAFEDCDSLTSITIPDSVTTIGKYAFYWCYSLTSITIGDSVMTIGEYAFRSCDSLTNITIPDSVTTIEYEAFAHCYGLTSITIPDSVTTIGDYAFSDCFSLTSITIPDSVTTIGDNTFYNCIGLTEFNGELASEDGKCLIIDGTLNSFALGCGATEYTIPDSVTTIGDGAFLYCSSLTSVTIPVSVTTIGESAFYYCFSLTSVTIGDSVTTIGENAFYGCKNLTSITIPDSVTTIGDSAFVLCSSLTSVYCKATTPPSLGGSYVFDGNASGRTIYVPAASVEAYKTADYWSEYADYIIGYDFEKGEVVEPEVSINNVIHYTATAKVEEDWTSDTFGANISSHEWDSESGEGVITFNTDVTTIGSNAFQDCNNLTSVTIPDSVTAIGMSAFYLCTNLASINIPDGVTTIGAGAFTKCASLTSITIPDSVTTIGFYAFQYCSSLTSITIPDSVTTIGEAAFLNCDSLTEFNGKFASEDGRCLIIEGTLNSFAPAGLTSYTIPDSVTTIGERAFHYCISLTSVTIPYSVTTIGDSAFFDCNSLTNITIPDSVTTIGMAAFQYCSSLTSITIPDSVTTIRDDAFRECYCLTSVFCEATTPPSLDGGYVFYSNASGRTIYVPAASVEAYKTAERWSAYADAIVGYDFENGEVVE